MIPFPYLNPIACLKSAIITFLILSGVPRPDFPLLLPFISISPAEFDAAADRLFGGYRPFGKPAVMNRFSGQLGRVVRTHAVDLKYYALA